MGVGIHRPTRIHPLVAHGSVGTYVWSRVFSHPLGRFQNVQVLRGGARKNDYHLGNILDSGNTLDSGYRYISGYRIMCPPRSRQLASRTIPQDRFQLTHLSMCQRKCLQLIPRMPNRDIVEPNVNMIVNAGLAST